MKAEFEPMKGEALTDPAAQLKRWPWLVSRKLDGIRCVVRDGVALSYNLKPIRNKYVQARIGHKKCNGLDGELIVGSPTEGLVLGRTMSGVMSAGGEPDFTFWVFDDFSCAETRGFNYRIGRVEDRAEDLAPAFPVSLSEHTLIYGLEQLAAYEAFVLSEGYEGVVGRHPNGPYKHGKATILEGWMWKLKRFDDGEALVEGVEEGFVNNNPAETDNLGRTKRSTHQENQAPSGKVGTLLCHDLATGAKLRVSAGKLTAKEREEFFLNPKLILGRYITHRSFNYGVKDAPRFCNFHAFRDPADMEPSRTKAPV